MAAEGTRMTSYRPYLLRALYDWISDNDLTPYIVVDASRPGVRVPKHVVRDGKVVLNIAARSVANLVLGDEALMFDARFGGVSQALVIPVAAVQAIYAHENGQGMGLPEDPPGAAPSGPETPAAPPKTASPVSPVAAVPDNKPDGDGPPAGGDAPKRGGHLRVVK